MAVLPLSLPLAVRGISSGVIHQPSRGEEHRLWANELSDPQLSQLLKGMTSMLRGGVEMK